MSAHETSSRSRTSAATDRSLYIPSTTASRHDIFETEIVLPVTIVAMGGSGSGSGFRRNFNFHSRA